MGAVQKIDSNATGLRYSRETSIGVADGSAVWYPLEPNEYDDFGGEYGLTARRPINSDRQRRKGVITDLDAAGGFTSDLIQNGLQDLMQGFFFADFRRKGEEAVTLVDIDGGNPDEYEVASTTGFLVNSIIKGKGFTNAANNAANVVTAVVASTSVEVVTGSLVAETPPAGATITVVGHQGAAGDIDVDASGTLPALTSTALDFTTLGLIPGEWVFIGGDSAGTFFATAANNCWARIYTVAANRLTFDKTSKTMVTEASTTETIRIYFGRVIKNEATQSLQVRRTYQIERTLGASDDALPSQIQSEYLVGAVPSEMTINFSTADKALATMMFMATDHEQRTGATGVKAGTRPSLSTEDTYNTSNDFAVLKMHILDRAASSNPTDLFAFLSELEISLNNNVSPNKAISRLGAFDMTAGVFEVSGSAEAYFSNVTAVAAVRNNSDVTMHGIMVKDNAGMAFDIPLIALGDGRLNVEIDEPVKLELEMPAAADEVFNHTFLMVFYDYLPNLASA
jgi:Phage tail tube protein